MYLFFHISRVCYLFGPHVAVKLDADFYLFPHGIHMLMLKYKMLCVMTICR